MKKGYIQVYTGEGKGKTTAALGLALRAAGAGMRICIIQFVKSRRCAEHRIIEERLSDLITIRKFGAGLIGEGGPTGADKEGANKALREARTVLESDGYDVVILDEVNVAVHYGLVSLSDLLDLMEKKPENVELIITGRYAAKEVMTRADLVTEMKEVTHYWKKGVKARHGIEW
ncbi:MAG TPA: cob(I)yrinic acid a,c-diamide adenosyltransferase [Syntrophorhabdaceae bacterium]|jgi:cob(I)alamin adenosyltransferase